MAVKHGEELPGGASRLISPVKKKDKKVGERSASSVECEEGGGGSGAVSAGCD